MIVVKKGGVLAIATTWTTVPDGITQYGTKLFPPPPGIPVDMPGVFQIFGAEVYGTEIIYSLPGETPGEADGTIVNSGGTITMYGGVAIGGKVLSGGSLDAYGGDTYRTVVSGSMLDGGTAFGTIVNGSFTVTGIATNTTVKKGGKMVVDGEAKGTTILRGGTETVIGGGRDSKMLVNGGSVYLIAGGSTVAAMVENGGALNVTGPGTANYTHVDGTSLGHSMLLVGPGATANLTSIGSYSTLKDYGKVGYATITGPASLLEVKASGSANHISIGDNGNVLVDSGGMVSTVTIGGSGAFSILTLASGAIAKGITFEGSGPNILDILGTGTYGTVTGFAVGDEIDLDAVNFKSAIKQFNSTANTLTVTDEIHSVSIELLGHYSAGSFHLGADGLGGTVVTDPAAGATIASMIASPHH
jgi:autotransporter passenger strand-loop-strand repeat protein